MGGKLKRRGEERRGVRRRSKTLPMRKPIDSARPQLISSNLKEEGEIDRDVDV